MKTCALYAKGVTPEECLDTQFAQLRKMAARRHLQVVGEYIDRCPFGSNARRRGLEALISDARRHRFEVVLVPSLSAMFRSTRDLLQTTDELKKCAVGLVSIKEGLNTSGRSAGTAFRVLNGISGLEADLRREKVCFGIYLRKFQGFSVGRQSAEVNKKALVADRLAGLSLTNVAKKYGVSRASVVRFTREAQRTAAGKESQWSNSSSGVQQAPRPRSRAQR